MCSRWPPAKGRHFSAKNELAKAKDTIRELQDFLTHDETVKSFDNTDNNLKKSAWGKKTKLTKKSQMRVANNDNSDKIGENRGKYTKLVASIIIFTNYGYCCVFGRRGGGLGFLRSRFF